MDWLYDVNIYSVTLRLVMAVLFGGLIGLERGANKHQAGFRTHILVCMGAALAMLTNQYIFQNISSVSDPARLGAQVISGMGFLGAGLILVTHGNKVKGLTTAAGLWASACAGLAIGVGFYAAALVAGVLIYLVLAILPSLEVYFYNRSRVMNLYIELDSMNSLRELLKKVRERKYIIYQSHIEKSTSVVDTGYSLNLSIRIPLKITHEEVIEILSSDSGVFLVEELE